MREKATIRIFTFHLTLFDGGKGHNPYLYFPFGAIRQEKMPQSVSLLSIWRYSTRENSTIRVFTFHLALFDKRKGHNPNLYFQFSPIRREKRPQSVSLLSIWRYSTREKATIRIFTFNSARFDERKGHNQYLYFPFGTIRQEKRPQSESLLSIQPDSTREKATISIFTFHLALFDKRKCHNPYLYISFGAIRRGKRPQSVSLLSIWRYSTREKTTIRIFTFHLALFNEGKGHNPYLYFPLDAIRRGKRSQSVSLLSLWRNSTREKATIRIFTFHLALFDKRKGHNPYLYFPFGAIRRGKRPQSVSLLSIWRYSTREKTTIRIFTFHLALFNEGKGHNPYLYFPLDAIRRGKRSQSVSLLSLWRNSTREKATIRIFTFHLALFDEGKGHNPYLYFPFGAIRPGKRPQSVSLLSIWRY